VLCRFGTATSDPVTPPRSSTTWPAYLVGVSHRVYTNDLGRIDQNGYFYLLDRASDLIIWGGFNIYPAELRNIIAGHPEILEVAVFAVPDDR
jgi:acyl-CoA synthetase (AMP-forming)/AMP-acid ligase II